MTSRIEKVELEINEIKTAFVPLKIKVDALHDKKARDNDRLQVFQGMLDMFKENQDAFAKSFREDFREEMKALSSDIAKLMNWRYMIIGGLSALVALPASEAFLKWIIGK